MASTQSLIRSPNETLIAGRLNLNYDLAVQVFRCTVFSLSISLSLFSLTSPCPRRHGIYFSETKVRARVHVSASDARWNVVQSTSVTPGDTRSRGLIYARRYLVALKRKREKIEEQNRFLVKQAYRAIVDIFSSSLCNISLKSYLPVRNIGRSLSDQFQKRNS